MMSKDVQIQFDETKAKNFHQVLDEDHSDIHKIDTWPAHLTFPKQSGHSFLSSEKAMPTRFQNESALFAASVRANSFAQGQCNCQ
jgi:hypothetical protein